jgi:hypothetical protein
LNCYFKDGVKIYQSERSVAYGSCDIILGVENHISNPLITVYPNPANNTVYVDYTHTSPMSIIIYDSMGRLVKKKHFSATLDVTDLTNGIYILMFYYDEIITSKHLIINK